LVLVQTQVFPSRLELQLGSPSVSRSTKLSRAGSATSDALSWRNCRLPPVGVPPPGVKVWSAVFADCAAAVRTGSASPALPGGTWLSTSVPVEAAQDEEAPGNFVNPTRATVGLPVKNAPITCLSTSILLDPPGVTGLAIDPDLSSRIIRFGFGRLKASGTLRASWATESGFTGSKS